MLTREQVAQLLDTILRDSVAKSDVFIPLSKLRDHDAALRAEIEQYRGALEVLQSARDCMLADLRTGGR